MIHRIVRLIFVFLLFTLGTQDNLAQRKNKRMQSKEVTEVITPLHDTVAIYQGDFKIEFLKTFFKESGKIVYNGSELRFVLSLVLSDTGDIDEVIVLGIDNSNVKERMKTIAKSLGTWTPQIKEGQSVKSQVTIPFSIKGSDFIINSNKLLEESKQEK
ncbi:hypothetical protein LNQ81_07145 [Myroides sp. M-43]|uniref:hypothetical protein n=1 Tax=Myroides oncorhynchi TaxID=2893756 RepID=UPI001E3FB92C|nr:hypothetical protein [Myroides oncorhynchi]MCC9042468.1 hypothetical protein [Myroides oncorhynchi]